MKKKWLKQVWDFIGRRANDDYFAMNTRSPRNNTVARRTLILLRNFLSGLFISCLTVRFFVKDWLEVSAMVYYTTPLPVLALFAFMLGIMWLFDKRVQAAKLFFALTIGCLLGWSCSRFSANSNAAAPGNVKLFFWNAAYNRRAEEITGYVRQFDADIIGIVEAGTRTRKARNVWKSAFPGYNLEILAGDMALMTKGEILAKESGSLGKRGRFNLLKVILNGKTFFVLLVDVDGDPFKSRAPAFASIDKLIRSHSQANLIVMGDFNTPLDSVLFESFRRYLTHAFESAGHGFAETWPIPLPVLTIDHIWVSKTIKVASCHLNWSRLSDHRSMVANIEPPCLWP